jgi:hypothetical protein
MTETTPAGGAAAAPPAAVPPAAAPPAAAPPADRDPDLVLARAHLRLGSLGLARAELETLAGRDRLDDEGIRDLAEARWRTGDVTGAGEAAAAYLEAVPDDIVALVIAAEAQADLGRPAEARRLAGRAVERADGSLDPVFAGMRRSAIWPPEPGTAVGPAGVLFDDLHPGPIGSAAAHGRRASDPPAGAPEAAPHAPLDPAVPAAIHSGPGLWDDHPASDSLEAPQPADPATLLQRARVALDQGETAGAATGLILALRASPDLAPAVLDLLGGRTDPILLLVRGDAQQIVGREVEAMRDHASAADRLSDALVLSSPGDMAHQARLDLALTGPAITDPGLADAELDDPAISDPPPTESPTVDPDAPSAQEDS